MVNPLSEVDLARSEYLGFMFHQMWEISFPVL